MMRTTTLLVCLSLLGLAAAAPTASAAQIGEPDVDPGPCSYEGTTLQAQTLHTTYTVKCAAVDYGLFAAGFAIAVANIGLKLVDDLAEPVITAAYEICQLTLDDCTIILKVRNVTDFTIQPPSISLDAQFATV